MKKRSKQSLKENVLAPVLHFDKYTGCLFLFEPVLNTENDANENGRDPFLVLLKLETG